MIAMPYSLGADALLVLHLGFVLFALFGGLLVARWRGWLPIHLLAMGWAIYVELADRGCPLTHWEQTLRQLAGETGYSEGFIEHYVLPLLYPDWLTLPVQYVLAGVVLIINLLIYLWVWHYRRHARDVLPDAEHTGTSHAATGHTLAGPEPAPCWALYRIDDNGNEVEMHRFSDYRVAEQAMHDYERRGHKQAYLLREVR
ncbi:hypothetical protein YO5_11660 [Stutzerimonas stutzeri TS44]|nr:hypothetical protein YO5_11660 [Stutzerimonas stutzeri TS44]